MSACHYCYSPQNWRKYLKRMEKVKQSLALAFDGIYRKRNVGHVKQMYFAMTQFQKMVYCMKFTNCSIAGLEIDNTHEFTLTILIGPSSLFNKQSPIHE